VADVLPVTSVDDVLAVLPAFLLPDDPAPVRDAILAALAQILLTYQTRSAYAAAQSDILRAVGRGLAEACAEHGVYKQTGETDDALRARALTVPSLVTPAAILAAANTVLAPYTSVLPQYSEAAQDRWFVGGGAPRPWRSFLFKKATTPLSPFYPDRLYPEDAATNGGYVRPQSSPGAARVYSDAVGRYFLLRVPDLSPLDASLAATYAQASVGQAVPNRMFVGKGKSPTNATYLRKIGASAIGVYEAIVNAVDRIKGAGIRWQLLVDPRLR
jgi:hypothetical protein